MMTGAERYKALADSNYETYLKKNHDYGDSFHETYKDTNDITEGKGIVAAYLRITDKYKRFRSLIKLPDSERKVKDESIRDTLLDMANYAIMTVMEIDREKEEGNVQA